MARRRESLASRSAGGYTLLEILVVVAVLGIAAALLVPAMGQTDSLRVQAAVRTVVADITYMQSDALAYQDRRALVFSPVIWQQAPQGGSWGIAQGGTNLYTGYDVNGAQLTAQDIMIDEARPGGQMVVPFTDPRFAGAAIMAVNIDGGTTLIFDEIGGPVSTLSGDTPSAGGSITIQGSGQEFRINIEGFTGQVTVERVENP